MNRMESLYPTPIRTHHAHPYHFEKRTEAETIKAYNPVCGDRFEIYLSPNDKSVYFHGFGCAVSKASCSVMAQSLDGKTTTEALVLVNRFLAALESQNEPSDLPEDWRAFHAVQSFPERKECATLAWTAMKKYLESVTPHP